MFIHAYKHARLMEESELRVEMAANSSSPADIIASRILQRRDTYSRWTAEHDLLMRAVSAELRLARQVVVLRSTAFRLVHRRALFEYLRDRQVTGTKRRKLFETFYSNRDFANAVLAEHGNYVRCSSSFLCTRYLGEQLMHDDVFEEPMQLYEQWYGDYFRAFCDVALAETEEEKRQLAPIEALKPLLKYRLAQAREALLAMPTELQQNWREAEIRKPNGDTQRLRVIFGGAGQVN